MNVEDVIERVGSEVRIQLHRLDGHIDMSDVPPDFTASVRRLVDQTIERAYVEGQTDAARNGVTRTAFLTIEGEWRDIATHTTSYEARVIAEQVATAMHDGARRFAPETDEPRYTFDEHSDHAISFFGEDTGDAPASVESVGAADDASTSAAHQY